MARGPADAPEPIRIGEGGTLTIAVTVDQGHLAPYSVKLDQTTLLDSVVGGSATTSPLKRGTHELSWFFIHTSEADWNHEISAQVPGGKQRVLEKRSKASGDPAVGGDAIEVIVS